MIVNLDDISYYYDYCNGAYFNNELPLPFFEVEHSYRFCARFTCDRKWFSKDIYNPVIYISDYWQFPEKTVINLMVHEMIHYYLALNRIDIKDTHGKEFKKMARKLNKQYKLHVTEVVDTSKLKRNPAAPLLGYWWHKLYR